jgi:hypothetical protein
MGSTVGAYKEKEVEHLSKSDRQKLKRLAIRHLQNSKEIHAIIESNPKLFTKIPAVKRALRKKLDPVRKRTPKR